MNKEDDSFLLHLISNAQPELYENQAAHFKTLLDSSLDFPAGEKWEVGLKEFGYVNNINTVTDDCRVRIGKIYETEMLATYLPYYLLEGGSTVVRHYIYRGLKQKETNPITTFQTYIKHMGSGAIQVKKSKPTIFYIGSNMEDMKETYEIALASPSPYEILENEACTYMLVLSPALALSFQLPGCVVASGKSLQSKIIYGTTFRHETVDPDLYWFYILPMHRSMVTKHVLLSSRLGQVSVLEFFRQLQWYGCGTLTTPSSTELRFDVGYESPLTGIYYQYLANLIHMKGLDVFYRSTAPAQQLLLDMSSIMNISVKSAVTTNFGTKRREELALKKAAYEQVKKEQAKLRRDISKFKNHPEQFQPSERTQHHMRLKQLISSNQDLKVKEQAYLQLYHEEKQRHDDIRRRQKTLKLQLLSNSNQYYHNVNPPSFYDRLPTSLDFQTYQQELKGLIADYKGVEKNSEAYKKALIHFARNNSLLFYIGKGETCVFDDSITKWHYDINIKEGFYTFTDLIEMLNSIFIQDGHHLMTLTYSQSSYGYKVNAAILTQYRSAGIAHVDLSKSPGLREKFPSKKIYNKTIIEYKVSAHDLDMSHAHILQCNDVYRKLIREEDEERVDFETRGIEMETRAKEIELIRMAEQSCNIIYLEDDSYIKYYFYDEEEGYHESILQYNHCKLRIGDACFRPELYNLGIDNFRSEPEYTDIDPGFYTVFSLVQFINENISYIGQYWLNVAVHGFYYEITFKLPKGASIEFDPYLCQVLSNKYANFDLKPTRYKNGHVLKIPILASRSYDPNLTKYPYANVDRYQSSSVNLTGIPLFMHCMFGRPLETLEYDPSFVALALQTGLLTYDETMFYLVPGVSFHIKSKNPLSDMMLHYTPDTEFIHTYCNQLQPQSNALLNLDNVSGQQNSEQDYMRTFREILIPKGQYTTRTLVSRLNIEMSSYLSDIKLILSEDGFLTIKTGPESYIDLRDLQGVLDLPIDFLGPSSIYQSIRPVDIVPNSHNIIIYCNIVGETVVGGQRERILRIFPNQKYQLGSMVNETMQMIDYYPLYLRHIKEIEITFRGDDGELVPLQYGRSYVKLHFRQIKDETS